MPLVVFTYCYNTDTREFVHVSNIAPPEAALPVALRDLHEALISQAVNRAAKPDIIEPPIEEQPPAQAQSAAT